MSPKGFGPESKKFNTIEDCAVRTLGTCANVYCDKMFCVTSICFAPGAYSLVTATACSMVPLYFFVRFGFGFVFRFLCCAQGACPVEDHGGHSFPSSCHSHIGQAAGDSRQAAGSFQQAEGRLPCRKLPKKV